ncbi:MAG: hypothetical protein AAGB22_15880, partial [Bacteroidota bacterium]
RRLRLLDFPPFESELPGLGPLKEALPPVFPLPFRFLPSDDEPPELLDPSGGATASGLLTPILEKKVWMPWAIIV